MPKPKLKPASRQHPRPVPTPVAKRKDHPMPATKSDDTAAPGSAAHAAAAPAGQPAHSGQAAANQSEGFGEYPTTQIKSWRDALRHPVASDASFASAVAGVLGLLLDRELRHPARMKRDEDARKANQKAQGDASKRDIEARYAAEEKGLPLRDGKPDADAKKALDERKKAELDAVDANAKREDLNLKQVAERDEFHRKQAEEAAKLNPQAAPTA